MPTPRYRASDELVFTKRKTYLQRYFLRILTQSIEIFLFWAAKKFVGSAKVKSMAEALQHLKIAKVYKNIQSV